MFSSFRKTPATPAHTFPPHQDVAQMNLADSLLTSENVSNGLPHGHCEYKTEGVHYSGSMHYGLRHGKMTAVKGDITRVGTYWLDARHGVFQYETLGKKLKTVGYKHGQLHGQCIIYTEDESVYMDVNYDEGCYHGECIFKTNVLNYYRGCLHGKCVWKKNGQVWITADINMGALQCYTRYSKSGSVKEDFRKIGGDIGHSMLKSKMTSLKKMSNSRYKHTKGKDVSFGVDSMTVSSSCPDMLVPHTYATVTGKKHTYTRDVVKFGFRTVISRESRKIGFEYCSDEKCFYYHLDFHFAIKMTPMYE